jgi:hypothetical protein
MIPVARQNAHLRRRLHKPSDKETCPIFTRPNSSTSTEHRPMINKIVGLGTEHDQRVQSTNFLSESPQISAELGLRPRPRCPWNPAMHCVSIAKSLDERRLSLWRSGRHLSVNKLSLKLLFFRALGPNPWETNSKTKEGIAISQRYIVWKNVFCLVRDVVTIRFSKEFQDITTGCAPIFVGIEWAYHQVPTRGWHVIQITQSILWLAWHNPRPHADHDQIAQENREKVPRRPPPIHTLEFTKSILPSVRKA